MAQPRRRAGDMRIMHEPQPQAKVCQPRRRALSRGGHRVHRSDNFGGHRRQCPHPIRGRAGECGDTEGHAQKKLIDYGASENVCRLAFARCAPRQLRPCGSAPPLGYSPHVRQAPCSVDRVEKRRRILLSELQLHTSELLRPVAGSKKERWGEASSEFVRSSNYGPNT